MRLKTVFLLLPCIIFFWGSSSAQTQTKADPFTPAQLPEVTQTDRDAQELAELRIRLRNIESMLVTQKDRENELLRDLNRMILSAQEEPEDTAAEEAKQELAAAERRFMDESAALESKIQQLEIALAAGQERDLQMGQQMNKTILVTVSVVAGVGLIVFLITVYLQYRLLSRPVQPVYMPHPSLAIESDQNQLPGSKNKTEPESETGLVENSKVKDTNEKFVSAVDRLEERIRRMESGLSDADDVLSSEDSVDVETVFEDPIEVFSPEQSREPVIVEEFVVQEEAVSHIDSSEIDDELPRELDEMDVAVLEEEGKLFLQKEEWRTALTYFEQLVKLDAERVDNWVNRGRALEMLNREDEAIRSYDNAIEVNPELPSPFLYKAALLSRLERFEEAQKFYNAALSKVPVQKSEETAVAS